MKDAGEKIFSEPEYETCVLCGKTTKILCTELVQKRTGYVEGCGQLCPDCARKIMDGQNKNIQK